MLVRCPVCKTEFRLVGFDGDERVVCYFCSTCERIVRVDLELDEIPSTSSAGSFRDVHRRFTVLVAGDDAAQRRWMGDLLESAGYHVVVAGNGSEALKLIRTYHPDLVVLDRLLPMISGIELLRAMERDHRLKEIPVMALQGAVKKRVSDFLRQPGAVRFIERRDLRGRLVRETRKLLGRAVSP